MSVHVPVKFIVLATQRSGSTWVVDMLDSHPRVVAYSELLLEDGRGRPEWGGAKDLPFWATYAEESRAGDATDGTLLHDYLDRVYAARPGVHAAGFKLMYGQAGAHPALHAYLRTERTRVVHLIRRNLLDILVSKEVAAARDAYHARVDQKVARVRVRLDVAKLPDRLAWQEREVEKARAMIADAALPCTEVFYEDLRADVARFDELLDFLDVGGAGGELSSSLRPMNDAPHREVVGNYEAVARALEGGRFARYLP